MTGLFTLIAPPLLFFSPRSRLLRSCFPILKVASSSSVLRSPVHENRLWRGFTPHFTFPPQILLRNKSDMFYSWGAGTAGQLGTGGFDDSTDPCPVQLQFSELERLSIACGGSHVIAKTDGAVFSWGATPLSGVEIGSNVPLSRPTYVPALHNLQIVRVAAGWAHVAFITAISTWLRGRSTADSRGG
uniref:Regulator of chromosome condensation family protein n=1 Tax=Tetraselmis sp. GSL018 TaxID=582737 RepID=A0A061QYW4_9CHLO